MNLSYLQKGDTIALAAASRKIKEEDYLAFEKYLIEKSFNVIRADNLSLTNNYFAGNDKDRIAAMNVLFENPEIKAIFMIRGGYGAARIVDSLNWDAFLKNPKWLCGYSDVSVFLNHVFANYKMPSLHADMPVHFPDRDYDRRNFSEIINVLSGKTVSYELSPHNLNSFSSIKGVLVGGNLSVLYSLLGSNSFPETKDAILFIEDLDEELYNVDRMILALKRAGVFERVNGVLLGGMTEMKDSETSFGFSAEELIVEHLKKDKIPLIFNFPAGHTCLNLPFYIGKEAVIEDLDGKIVFSQAN